MMRGVLFCFLMLAGTAAFAGDHAVILLYHRVSDSGPDSTRISPAQFHQHLDWIRDNGFQVVALTELLDSIYSGGDIPANSVAITFDDAYASVYHTAYPALKARGMPFTVFIATQPLDKGAGAFMNWSQTREMHQSGLATFGSHSLTHDHLEHRREGESRKAWKGRVRGEILDSHRRIGEEIGATPAKLFAYPFGEYSQDTIALVRSLGFTALAQQSGALGPDTPRERVPRFAMSQHFGSLDRLAMALKSRPLPATEASELPYVLRPGEPQPDAMQLKVGPSLSAGSVNCFAASGERLATRRNESTITVTLPALTPGRNKINCTAPSGRAGEYYWFSRLWLVVDREGNWLNY